MPLEDLRSKAYFQNTIDVWIILCEEKGWNWFDVDSYVKFVSHLRSKNLGMQKFPLCIKEAGGTYERGMDKTRFAENLSSISSDDAAAYTLKLNSQALVAVRAFNIN